MSEKRRDKRNRILHNGETQRADGRYRFTYQVQTVIQKMFIVGG